MREREQGAEGEGQREDGEREGREPRNRSFCFLKQAVQLTD